MILSAQLAKIESVDQTASPKHAGAPARGQRRSPSESAEYGCRSLGLMPTVVWTTAIRLPCIRRCHGRRMPDKNAQLVDMASGDDTTISGVENAAEQDRLTLAQQESIRQNISATQALIAESAPPAVLADEYKDNPEKGFLLGVEDLCKRYQGIRRVRGDGNCFYRAFLYAYLSSLLKGKESTDEAARKKAADALKDLLERVRASKDVLVSVGYNETAIESFWEVFVEELESLPDKSMDDLYQAFNEEAGTASYMTWYCRLLTAGHLKLHKDEFSPFIDDGVGDVDAFCAREVEPIGKECEQIQMMALTQALGVGVRIEYLDGRNFRGQLDQIVLPEGMEAQINLLYRPGHYDILETFD